MKSLRTTWPLATLLLALAIFSSFRSRRDDVRHETRTVATFSQLVANGSGHVTLVQGSPQRVEVEGSAEALAHFETEVKGTTLNLYHRAEKGRPYSANRDGKVNVYITVPDLSTVRLSGSGAVMAEGAWQAQGLELTLSGSGDLKFNQLAAKNVKASLSGSGGIALAGSAPQLECGISGSGNIRARDFKTESLKARISGSGDVYAFATKQAEARISGSGSVHVGGGAALRSSINGSGKLLKD